MCIASSIQLTSSASSKLYIYIAWRDGEERILSLLAVEKGREGGRRAGREGVIQ